MANSITLNQIISTLRGIKNTKTFDLSYLDNFIQPLAVPENIVQEDQVFIEETNTNSLRYEKEGILFLPDEFKDFLDLNKYYIYGASNWVECFQVLLNENYMNQGTQEKRESCDNFKNNLLDNLNTKFKEYDYSKKDMPMKTNIVQSLNSESLEDRAVIQYVSDYYSLNILYVDIAKKKFSMFKCLEPEKTNNNLVIMELEGHLVPLVNIKLELFSYKDLIKISQYFNEKKSLKKISSYTISELTELAKQNNVSIFDSINNKKKTKKILYDDLVKALE